MKAQSNYSERILRLPQVKSATGLSRSSIYAKAKSGEFPRHITLGIRCVGWLESEVQDWINSRVTASRTARKTPSAGIALK